MKSALGIVVPTLGGRPDFLNSALESIHRAANVNVCVVVPEHLLDRLTSRDLVDVIVSDPGKGLAAAINAGINALPPSVEYVNWLGDDDLLIGTGIQDLEAGLCHNKHAVLAYGHCRYVSMSGATLFDIRAGRWAEKILRFGPQLLSQPAMLFRRETFVELGGLDERLNWAFDLDLILRLAQKGAFVSVPKVTAAYRWHPDALSVGKRSGSVREASFVRRRNLPIFARKASIIWEPTVSRLILVAGKFVAWRVRKTTTL